MPIDGLSSHGLSVPAARKTSPVESRQAASAPTSSGLPVPGALVSDAFRRPRRDVERNAQVAVLSAEFFHVATRVKPGSSLNRSYALTLRSMWSSVRKL